MVDVAQRCLESEGVEVDEHDALVAVGQPAQQGGRQHR